MHVRAVQGTTLFRPSIVTEVFAFSKSATSYTIAFSTLESAMFSVCFSPRKRAGNALEIICEPLSYKCMDSQI